MWMKEVKLRFQPSVLLFCFVFFAWYVCVEGWACHTLSMTKYAEFWFYMQSSFVRITRIGKITCNILILQNVKWKCTSGLCELIGEQRRRNSTLEHRGARFWANDGGLWLRDEPQHQSVRATWLPMLLAVDMICFQCVNTNEAGSSSPYRIQRGSRDGEQHRCPSTSSKFSCHPQAHTHIIFLSNWWLF